jgi:hypothetical protein
MPPSENTTEPSFPMDERNSSSDTSMSPMIPSKPKKISGSELLYRDVFGVAGVYVGDSYKKNNPMTPSGVTGLLKPLQCLPPDLTAHVRTPAFIFNVASSRTYRENSSTRTKIVHRVTLLQLTRGLSTRYFTARAEIVQRTLQMDDGRLFGKTR